jgi:hypothetical protein
MKPTPISLNFHLRAVLYFSKISFSFASRCPDISNNSFKAICFKLIWYASTPFLKAHKPTQSTVNFIVLKKRRV